MSDAIIEAAAGSVGSIISLLLTYPLKTIYTLQALSSGHSETGAHQALSIISIIKRYRLSGLYVGIEPNILESGVSSAVYFYLYSRLRAIAVRATELKVGGSEGEVKQGSRRQDIGIGASLLVAALAGTGNQLVTMPASVVTTRMQAQAKLRMDSGQDIPTGAWHVISSIRKESGLGGFWAGLLPALVLVVNPAVQYMLYEQIQRLMRRWKRERHRARIEKLASSSGGNGGPKTAGNGTAEADDKGEKERNLLDAVEELSAAEYFMASALAKIGATVVTYPMIVVKSRMQAASKAASSPGNYGTYDQILRILQSEGLGGFFKGLRAKILQTALNAALMLTLKEQSAAACKALLAEGAKRSPDLGRNTLGKIVEKGKNMMVR